MSDGERTFLKSISRNEFSFLGFVIESQEEDESIDLIAQPLLPVLESVESDTESFVSKNNNNINIPAYNMLARNTL